MKRLFLHKLFRVLPVMALALVFWAARLGAAHLEADPAATNALNATNIAKAGVTNAAAKATGAALPFIPSGTITNTWLTFGLDRVESLHVEVMGNPLWQYLASLIYILLAFYVSKLLDSIIHVQLRRWAAKTQTRFDDIMLELVRGPVKVISFVILLHIGLRVFSWPEWGAAFISNGLKITVAVSLTYVALRFVDVMMGVWHQRVTAHQEGAMDAGLLPIIRKTIKIFVTMVAVLVTSQNLGMNITAFLASLSIGGLAVGLAAQDTLSNLFGAVAIFADKPFKVGDRIQVDAIDGNVETIGLRSTRVRSLDGYLISVPNKTIANANIINISKRPRIKTVVDIGVTYDTPPAQIQRAMEIIEEVYGKHPKTSELLVNFNRFDASALNIQVIHWWGATDYTEYAKNMGQLHMELKKRFDAERISFAFPTQTVYMKQDSEWRLVQEGSREHTARN